LGTIVWIARYDGSNLHAHHPWKNYVWGYHVVVFSGGKIHDAWCEDVLSPRQYCARVFAGQKLRIEYRSDENPSVEEIRQDKRLIAKRKIND